MQTTSGPAFRKTQECYQFSYIYACYGEFYLVTVHGEQTFFVAVRSSLHIATVLPNNYNNIYAYFFIIKPMRVSMKLLSEVTLR